MPINVIDNFLSEDLYEECILTAEYLLTKGENTFCTNRWWDIDIRKDSYPVFVHSIQQQSDLHHKIKTTIENKTKSSVLGDNIMFYYWTRHSYIPWHTDQTYKGALTIYLNRNWHEDFGGYFLYEDKKEIKAILPKRNLGIIQYDGVRHSTTPVNFDGDIRYTIQAFLQ
jgi:hypothetical protein